MSLSDPTPRNALAGLLGSPGFETLGDENLDGRFKGMPTGDLPVLLSNLGEQHWNILQGDLLLPVMAVRETALQANIDAMAEYCRREMVSLAPHAKTTMAPEIVRRQLAAGAWAITAATASQVRALRMMGVSRILLANELVERSALDWLAAELIRDPAFDCIFYVDSADGLAAAERAFADAGVARKVPVLVEFGRRGGRTGLRTEAGVLTLAKSVGQSGHLVLAGVAGFEGLVEGSDPNSTLAAVDHYLEDLRTVAGAVIRLGIHPGEFIVSAGGSWYFDRVVIALSPLMKDARIVLRSGGYVVHDDIMYAPLSPLDGRASAGEPLRLRSALELWATIWSLPEPGLAILGFGKRDAPYDAGLPVPMWHFRNGWPRPRQAARDWSVVRLDDQHAHVHTEDDADLRVGDLVGCGVAHPCSAFDRWRLLFLVDDEYAVVGGLRTFL